MTNIDRAEAATGFLMDALDEIKKVCAAAENDDILRRATAVQESLNRAIRECMSLEGDLGDLDLA